MSALRRSKRIKTKVSEISNPPSRLEKLQFRTQPNLQIETTRVNAISRISIHPKNSRIKTQPRGFQEPHLLTIALSSIQKRTTKREWNRGEEQNEDSSKYELLKPLFQGASGTIFLSYNRDGKKLAIKQVVSHRKRSNKELAILKMIDHPSLIKMIDHYFTSDKQRCLLHIVTQLYPYNLHTLIKQKAISKKLAPLYLFQILSGLNYLRQKNIMHRDLTPQNILVDPKTHRVVIADFGSAKICNCSENSLPQVGTRTYRAPQLLFGSSLYSCQIDMWSFGVIMIELITGFHLFKGKSNAEQIVQILKILGTPTQTEMSAMNPHYLLHQYQSLPKLKKKLWKDILNVWNWDLLDMIEQILVYDPQTRFTPEKAMQHSYFQSVTSEKYLRQLGLQADFFDTSEDQESLTKSINLSTEGPQSPLKLNSKRMQTLETNTPDSFSNKLSSIKIDSVRLKRPLF